MPDNAVRAVLFRFAGALPTLCGVVLVTFLLTRVLPGDTATYFAGPTASAESIAASTAVALVGVTALRHQRSARRAATAVADPQWAASSQLRPKPTETSSGTSRV